MNIQPYLYFEGHGDEAIAFYRQALGAEVVMLMRYGDAPADSGGDAGGCLDGQLPAADKVMHASLRIGDTQIMLSDGMNTGHPEFKGVSLALRADDDAAARRLFAALADGGSVQQPLVATFFSTSFGMVTDRFGVNWTIVVSPAAD